METGETRDGRENESTEEGNEGLLPEISGGRRDGPTIMTQKSYLQGSSSRANLPSSLST